MSSPASFRPEAFDLAVVALSARALAASARRAGLSALAIDLFADADTREHATLAVRAPASRRGPGFAGRRLLEILAAQTPKGLPVVLGAGFEHTPGLMRAIARRNRIAGASPETVALLKDPGRFAALLRDLAVPHPSPFEQATTSPPPPCGEGSGVGVVQNEPQKRMTALYATPHRAIRSHPHPHPPRKGEGAETSHVGSKVAPLETATAYLSKRIGASGGAHIRAGNVASRSASGRYLQPFVPGHAVSVLFLADGRASMILGFSEQWTDPTLRAPFRYGGAVGPVALPRPLADDIANAVDRIVAASGLVGLASADLILTEPGGFVLLEINPRPGATLDVFERGDAPSLLALHLDACAGRLPVALPPAAGARAAAIVYADRPMSPATLQRPVWTADWPSCNEIIPAGVPICTVLASGPSSFVARARLEERRASLLSRLRALPGAALNKKTHEEAHP